MASQLRESRQVRRRTRCRFHAAARLSLPKVAFCRIRDFCHALLSRDDICFRKCPIRHVEGFGFACARPQECQRRKVPCQSRLEVETETVSSAPQGR